MRYVIDVSGSAFFHSIGCFPGPKVVDCEVGAIANVSTKFAAASDNLVTNIFQSLHAFNDFAEKARLLAEATLLHHSDPKVATSLQQLNDERKSYAYL